MPSCLVFEDLGVGDHRREVRGSQHGILLVAACFRLIKQSSHEAYLHTIFMSIQQGEIS